MSGVHGQFELQRFTELLQAFGDLTRERMDIQLRGSAAPPLGFAVRLQPGPTSAGVEVSLTPNGGRLSKWPAEGQRHWQASRDRRVQLDLRTTFLWEGLAFPFAEPLARTVLQWMEDQLGVNGSPRVRMEAL